MDKETFSIRDTLVLSKYHEDLLIEELTKLAATEKTAMGVIEKFVVGRNKEAIMRGILIAGYLSYNEQKAREHDD